MSNTIKIIIHVAIIFGLIYLCSINFFPAQLVLTIYFLVLFFELKIAAYFFLSFIFLLPFFVYNLRMDIAEHYAISAYIFLSGCVIDALLCRKKIVQDFFKLNYSQIFHALTREKIFEKEDFSGKFNEIISFLIISSIFVFLLLSPLFGFFLINYPIK